MTEQPAPHWATELLGESVRLVDVLGGGTSRTTILLEVPPAQRLVARHDGGAGPLSGTPFTLRREAAAVAAARAAGIPAATVVAEAPDGRSYAVEALPGRPDDTGAALDDYLAVLGRLHATGLDHAPTGYAGFDPDGREDLQLWEQIAGERVRRPHPALDAAFAALRDHGALSPPDVVLCHGDAGTGNYLADGDRVTGVVDWEMSHTGDPHDDLASVAVRAALTGLDVGDLVARAQARWEPAAGRTLDRRRFDLAVTGVLARMVVSCLVALDNAEPGTDRTVQLMGYPVMEAMLLRSLAALDGAALAPVADVAPDPAFAAEVAGLLAEDLAAPLPGASDADAGRRRRLRYLADQLGRALGGREGAPSCPDPTDLPALWLDCQRRLAVLPASRRLAESPIPGATWC